MKGQEETPDEQVILLSRVLARMDQHEKMMKRVEEKVDAMYARMDEVLARTGQWMAAPAKEPKPTRPFADYIKERGRAPEILAQLHHWMDGTERVKALVYLKAAIDARVLEQPPYPVAKNEFPGIGSKSLYYNYLSEPNIFTEDDLKAIAEAKAVLQH